MIQTDYYTMQVYNALPNFRIQIRNIEYTKINMHVYYLV